MSPIMLSRHLRQPEPSKTITSGTSIRAPGLWFRASANQSVPDLPNSQHPNRARGFVSIRALARSTHRELSPDDKLLVEHPPPTHLLRNSASLYGTLRDQCTPPELTPFVPAVPGRFPSESSSGDSYTADQSGVSNDSSHPTTPSPARHRAFDQFEISPYAHPRSMGNQGSSILKKPLSLRAKQSLATIKGESKDDRRENKDRPIQPPGSPDISPTTTVPYSGKQLPTRASVLIPNVPRRRSSLTAIHLNSFHFDSIDPNHAQLQHRASTLTEPRQRRQSTLSDTLRPVISSIGPGTPVTQIDLRDTLSPPLLSPPLLSPRLSESPLSPSPSDLPSANSRLSVLNFPKTFPSGPIPVPAPRLTVCHYKCYQQHRRVFASQNLHCRVPCMACEGIEEPRYWKCIWCGLRLCATCMKEFDRQGRDLSKLLVWVKGKRERPKPQKENEQTRKPHTKTLSCGGASSENENTGSTDGGKGYRMQQTGKDVQVGKGLTNRKARDTV